MMSDKFSMDSGIKFRVLVRGSIQRRELSRVKGHLPPDNANSCYLNMDIIAAVLARDSSLDLVTLCEPRTPCSEKSNFICGETFSNDLSISIDWEDQLKFQ